VDAIAEGWHDFFLGQLGASAALAGLLFVAISINLERILAGPGLPDRAMLAILLLLGILVVSGLMLIPHQPTALAGIEALVVGAAVLAAGTLIEFVLARAPRHQSMLVFATNAALFAGSALPYIIGGVLLVFGDPAGLYWIAAAVVVSVVKAVADAWVLLVEIQR